MDWTTFESPANFYSISHPCEWVVATEGNVTNIITPDGDGAITVSAFHNSSYDFSQLIDLTRKMYAKAEVVTPFSPYQDATSEGITGEFKDNDGEIDIWCLVRGLHSNKVFVLITANDIDGADKGRKELFLKIINTLRVQDTKPWDKTTG
jgi:hypothetical protein